jgi:hypothetical protein
LRIGKKGALRTTATSSSRHQFFIAILTGEIRSLLTSDQHPQDYSSSKFVIDLNWQIGFEPCQICKSHSVLEGAMKFSNCCLGLRLYLRETRISSGLDRGGVLEVCSMTLWALINVGEGRNKVGVKGSRLRTII